jgi:hypothetical protein
MPMKNSLILLFIVLSSKILLAQTPYKYDPNTINGVGALNDLNWETTTPVFFDDMGDNSHTKNLWLYRSPDGQGLKEGIFYAVGGTLNDQDNYLDWDNNSTSNYSYAGLSHSIVNNSNLNYHKLRLDLMRDASNNPEERLTFYTQWNSVWRFNKYTPYRYTIATVNGQEVIIPSIPSQNLKHKFYGALLTSKSRFKYGYFEARFKVNRAKGNANQGIGQCFWLFPFGTLPAPRTSNYSEIDIAEIDAVNGRSTSNIHYREIGNTNDKNFREAIEKPTTANPNSTTGTLLVEQNSWQTYSCEWTPEEVNIYINGILMAHYEGAIVQNLDRTEILRIEKPKFLDEMNIVLDIEGTDIDHPGGHQRFGRNLDPNVNLPNLPFEFDIDYVKVYKLKNTGCEQAIIAQNSYNFSNYQHGLKKSIRFGLENCSNCSAIVNQQNISLRAADGISLEDGFEVTANSNTEFFATVNGDCNK